MLVSRNMLNIPPSLNSLDRKHSTRMYLRSEPRLPPSLRLFPPDRNSLGVCWQYEEQTRSLPSMSKWWHVLTPAASHTRHAAMQSSVVNKGRLVCSSRWGSMSPTVTTGFTWLPQITPTFLYSGSDFCRTFNSKPLFENSLLVLCHLSTSLWKLNVYKFNVFLQLEQKS